MDYGSRVEWHGESVCVYAAVKTKLIHCKKGREEQNGSYQRTPDSDARGAAALAGRMAVSASTFQN